METAKDKGETSYFLYDNPSSSSSYTSISYAKGDVPPKSPSSSVDTSTMGYQQAAAATPFKAEGGIIAEDIHKDDSYSPYSFTGELSCSDSLRWIREGWAIYRRHW